MNTFSSRRKPGRSPIDGGCGIATLPSVASKNTTAVKCMNFWRKVRKNIRLRQLFARLLAQSLIFLAIAPKIYNNSYMLIKMVISPGQMTFSGGFDTSKYGEKW